MIYDMYEEKWNKMDASIGDVIHSDIDYIGNIIFNGKSIFNWYRTMVLMA